MKNFLMVLALVSVSSFAFAKEDKPDCSKLAQQKDTKNGNAAATVTTEGTAAPAVTPAQ